MYTCPMHPEVRREKAGRCPVCGMALVPEAQVRKPTVHGLDRGLGLITWRSYLPLIGVFAALVLFTAALSLRDYAAGFFDILASIRYFMAAFFMLFAAFKLADIRGFAEGYATYDLLASRWFAYGYVYPFVEFGFGLAMAFGFDFPALLWTEVGVMLFSGVGVAIKLARREPFICACLGTFLKVPLTKITLIEDFGMAALALVLLFSR